MKNIEQILFALRESRVKNISVAGLRSRNPIAYKWKATFHCWVLREAVFWRLTDLLTQSDMLHRQQHVLGARILMRSGLETLALLIYLNHKIRSVLENEFNFHEFADRMVELVAGSKNDLEWPNAVNVLTMLDKGDKLYPGLRPLYDSLSESAHPNFDGLIWAYSKINHDDYETDFSNRWTELYGEQHHISMEACFMAFMHEYDTNWADVMGKLETWIVENDAMLEETRNDLSQE